MKRLARAAVLLVRAGAAACGPTGERHDSDASTDARADEAAGDAPATPDVLRRVSLRVMPPEALLLPGTGRHDAYAVFAGHAPYGRNTTTHANVTVELRSL